MEINEVYINQKLYQNIIKYRDKLKNEKIKLDKQYEISCAEFLSKLEIITKIIKEINEIIDLEKQINDDLLIPNNNLLLNEKIIKE